MRKPLSSESATAVGPYSHGIVADPFVYLSGQTPLDPKTGQLASGGIGSETNQCLDNLFGVLAADGLDESDVIKCNVYLTDMDDFVDMNTAYLGRFVEPYPARTTVAVAALPLGANVEIEIVARRR